MLALVLLIAALVVFVIDVLINKSLVSAGLALLTGYFLATSGLKL